MIPGTKTYHIAWAVDTKQIRDGQMQANGMAASLSEHTLWQAGCAAGVDDVDGVRGFDWYARSPFTSGARALDQGLPLPLAILPADRPPEELVALPAFC